MRETKLVSIIIPVYNCGEYLKKCICSVLSQSYKNIEVIVINDGSTDNSEDIIQQYVKINTNIVLIEQENMGVSAARNKGIEKATGEYILFVDGDDYIGKDYVSTFVEAAEKNNSDLVICGCTMVDAKGNMVQKLVPEKYERGIHEEWAYRLSSACSHFYRRKLWIDTGIRFAVGVRGEDLPVALFFNFICTNITIISKSEYYYVQHSDSAMGMARGLKNFQLPIEAIEEILERVKHAEDTNSYKFLEYGVMKAFAMFLFDLGRGADWQLIKCLCQKTENIILQYFPDYTNCQLNSYIDMPLKVKGAVWLLAKMLKIRALRPFMWFYCRIA